ncbi:hypothetical protein Tco_1473811 [Tanacetum coccineum]
METREGACHQRQGWCLQDSFLHHQAEQVAEEKERKDRTLCNGMFQKDQSQTCFMAWMMPKRLGVLSRTRFSVEMQ